MTLEQQTLARERFAQGYIITSQGCWEWVGAMAKHGRRGRFRLGKNKIMAYRAGWILAGNELSEAVTLDHRCTNPGCVNPAHMVPCSYKENQWRDMHCVKPQVLRGTA